MAPLLSEEEVALGDPYEVLGVPVDSTEKQIRSAYRSLSLRCHPDRVSHVDRGRASMVVRSRLMILRIARLGQFPDDEKAGKLASFAVRSVSKADPPLILIFDDDS